MTIAPVRQLHPTRALRLPDDTPARVSGSACVQAVEAAGRYVIVDAVRGGVAARVAASCLLQPSPGDRVAWWRDETDALWITAVLIRGEAVASQPPCVRLPPDARIVTDAGSITLAPAESLHLAPADELALRAARVSMATRTLDVVAQAVTASSDATRLIGRLLSTVFERVQAFAGTHQRTVDGLDQLQAGTLDHRAQGVAHLAGDTVVVEGARLIKQRAAQIHMG